VFVIKKQGGWMLAKEWHKLRGRWTLDPDQAVLFVDAESANGVIKMMRDLIGWDLEKFEAVAADEQWWADYVARVNWRMDEMGLRVEEKDP
jgi:hypothetical protein